MSYPMKRRLLSPPDDGLSGVLIRTPRSSRNKGRRRPTFIRSEDVQRLVPTVSDYPHTWTKVTTITSDGSVTELSKSQMGYTWITVKGKDSACLVTHDGLKDYIHSLSLLAQDYARRVMTIPSAIGMLIKGSSGSFVCAYWLRVRLKRKTQPSKEGSELSCHEEFAARFIEQKAINYLEKKMKQGSVLTHEETIQAAITALKYLLTYDFRARDIQAYVVGNDEDKGIHRALSLEEIKEQLSVINKEEIKGIHSTLLVEEIKEVTSAAQTRDSSNSSISKSTDISEEKNGGKDG